MVTMDDFPKHVAIKETIKTWTNEPKKKVFDLVMDEVIAELFIPFTIQVFYLFLVAKLSNVVGQLQHAIRSCTELL